MIMILALGSALLIFVSIAFKDSTKREDFINFDWMSGDWYMRGDGYTIYEHWDGKSEQIMEGYSVSTNHKGDTLGKEELRIIKFEDDFFYIAKPSRKKNPTTFKMIVDSIRKVSFYNETNEFPKLIEYTRKGDSLIATISSGKKVMTFKFKRE
ncbi:MAG: hypothetical protein CVV25_03535 [Ignavibacteriae bacterium HGW-Ignavibacteriae-4]|jgi:hypothetical protein|nr:MAG: hypothetical protein CVV25_03535 [Ignavibacteriae bacterium HGW-Ignavibacteriae-4]